MTEHQHHKYYTQSKAIAWTIITIGFAIFFFAVLANAYHAPIFDARNSIVVLLGKIILPLIMFSAFLGGFAIHAMIVKNKIYRYLVPLFASVSLFLFFVPTIWSILASIIIYATLIVYHASVQGDMKSRITVKPIFTIAAGLGTVILVLIASVSLLYYSTFVARPYALDDLRYDIRDSIVDSSLALAESQIDGFSADLTLDQIIANFLAGRLTADVLPQLELSLGDTQTDIANDPSLDSLKEAITLQAGEDAVSQLEGEQEATKQEIVKVVTEQLSEAEQQIIQEVRDELIQSLGIEASGDDTIRDVLILIVDRRIISIIDPYIEYAPIVFAGSLFFILYIFSFLYRYLTRGFGLLWYWILRVSHFIFIKEEDVKAQRISLEK